MYVCVLGGCYHFLHTHLSAVVTIGDVLSDTTVKEDRFLGNNANLGPEPLNIEIGDSLSVQTLELRYIYIYQANLHCDPAIVMFCHYVYRPI